MTLTIGTLEKMTVVSILCFFLYIPGSVFGQEENATEIEKMAEIPEWIKRAPFLYSAEGKPDPFKSFMDAKLAKAAQKGEGKTNKPASPLERFEVSQLKLVGIIWNEERPEKSIAMVELPDGKGFVMKKGARVGLNGGKVITVNKDQVQILEEAEDVLGDVVTRAIVLKLKAPQGVKNEN